MQVKRGEQGAIYFPNNLAALRQSLRIKEITEDLAFLVASVIGIIGYCAIHPRNQAVVIGTLPKHVFQHDFKVIPDSTIDLTSINRLKARYDIVDSVTISVPPKNYNVFSPPKGELLILFAALENGVRLPLHPNLRRALKALQLAPLLLTPGF
ncbi:hypothetical protein Ddye_016059 [Dipteronia dyeriana]|uniref:Uncharacterized protein n=1 Tax=Dipteronia dyeriana TaxID=168575 RepID=A0AAD9X046_9ROSI|nr:hypothetical protein Ddye_016059 [Dipteronia dyeriana]